MTLFTQIYLRLIRSILETYVFEIKDLSSHKCMLSRGSQSYLTQFWTGTESILVHRYF